MSIIPFPGQKDPLRIGVLGSGSGSNMQSIQDAIEAGTLNAKIVCTIADVPNAKILDRAKKHNIPCAYLDPAPWKTKLEGDAETRYIEMLQKAGAQVIVLAGFMRIVKKRFLDAFPYRVLNIHPALLPSFRGLHAQRQAVEAGVKIAGCTVHFVVPDMDAGPIILQSAVPVYEDDTEDTLAARILTKEHPTYVRAAALFCDDKLTIDGNVVKGTQE